jgi:hypothetical protein
MQSTHVVHRHLAMVTLCSYVWQWHDPSFHLSICVKAYYKLRWQQETKEYEPVLVVSSIDSTTHGLLIILNFRAMYGLIVTQMEGALFRS